MDNKDNKKDIIIGILVFVSIGFFIWLIIVNLFIGIIALVVFCGIILGIALRKSNKSVNDKNNISRKNIDYSKCIEMAKIISNNDENIIKEIEGCVSNPYIYYNKNKAEYIERSIMDSNNIDNVIWIGMVNCLIKNNYASECDWKVELDDFIYNMNKINYDITFNKDNLNKDGNVSEWCLELDKKLQKESLCIGGIDIDSDSYVMFICEKEKLEQLNKLSQNINHKITYASML